MSDSPAKASSSPESNVKETLISLLISFVMALMFRSYVVEAFIIPTGSMAPTLRGAHIQFQSPQSGHSWAVNPWYFANQETPLPIQGNGQFGLPTSTDPMSSSRINPLRPGGRPEGWAGYIPSAKVQELRAGDRILVHKYLYSLFSPRRWDVVVFKNPELATQNFIKRLIGLPNEQIWIADGDVFTRPVTTKPGGVVEPAGDWRIQRKPDRIQESLWRPVFSSEYAPLAPVLDGRRWFSSPWKGSGWQTDDRRSYRCDSAERTTLDWDTVTWPISDWVSYNDYPDRLMGPRGTDVFPVPDLRLRAAVAPDKETLSVIARIVVHGHEYQGVIAAGSATLRVRPVAPASAQGTAWRDLASAPVDSLPAGRATNIEFWRVDQTLELRVEGEVVVRSEGITWGPIERLFYATGTKGDAFEETTPSTNRLRQPETYSGSRPQVSWTFEGSPLTLHRVGLDRDIYYEPATFHSGPAAGTHPKRLVTLGADQFFVLGDNSPASKDGRLWEVVDPWVAAEIDPTIGVVPRDLMLGKAFLVYFPATYTAFGRIPIPDLGQIRFIK